MTDSKTSPQEDPRAEDVPQDQAVPGADTDGVKEPLETGTPVDSETPAEEVLPEEHAAAEAAQAESPGETKEEQEDFKDQYLRLRADFENFRKRTRREKEEWTQRCLENVFSDLMTILDHFDLGLENAKGQDISKETLQGFELTRGQLGSTLGKYGLKAVETESGTFDPNLQEAITHLPSTEVPEGEVVAMTRKGYQLGTKLLRPAQVVVSAGEGEG